MFKFLYTKYSATGFKIETIRCFEDMKDRKETMNLAEMYKMLKDHGISSKIISKNDLTNIMWSLNRYLNGWADLSPLNYEGFVEYFF